MTTPKSPEEIITSFDEYFPKPKFLSDSDQWMADVMSNAHQKSYHDFLRSSMASLLCYMAERMTKKENISSWDNERRNEGIDYCRTLLIEEARKIVKDMILNEMQPSEERIRKAAKEAAEDQNKMVEEARRILEK